jgi:hypothetical protein
MTEKGTAHLKIGFRIPESQRIAKSQDGHFPERGLMAAVCVSVLVAHQKAPGMQILLTLLFLQLTSRALQDLPPDIKDIALAFFVS